MESVCYKQSSLYTVNVQTSFLAPYPEPKISQVFIVDGGFMNLTETKNTVQLAQGMKQLKEIRRKSILNFPVSTYMYNVHVCTHWKVSSI